MKDDVVLNKVAIIERCMKRVKEEYLTNHEEFKKNFTKQDSVILNLERGCQAAIDLGTHILKLKKLGIPQNNREIFDLLEENGLIEKNLAGSLKSMTGFRNVAVHSYSKLNLDIVINIVEKHLPDLEAFSSLALKL